MATPVVKRTRHVDDIRPSGGFGILPPDRSCAVKGCKNPGMPQTCPHDNSDHRHGMIHYWCGYPKHSLTFREGWHLICDEHYEIVDRETREWKTHQARLNKEAKKLLEV